MFEVIGVLAGIVGIVTGLIGITKESYFLLLITLTCFVGVVCIYRKKKQKPEEKFVPISTSDSVVPPIPTSSTTPAASTETTQGTDLSWIVNQADEHIKLEITEQENRLKDEIALCMSSLGSLADSSASREKVAKLGGNAIMICKDLIWQVLHDLLITYRPEYSEELAKELKDVVKNYLPKNFGDMKWLLKDHALKYTDLDARLEKELASKRDLALSRVGIEIAKFLKTLK